MKAKNSLKFMSGLCKGLLSGHFVCPCKQHFLKSPLAKHVTLHLHPPLQSVNTHTKPASHKHSMYRVHGGEFVVDL